MRDETLARIAAAAVVAVFLVAQTIALVNPARPVPGELYPVVSLALAYLLGLQIVRRNGNGK